MNEAIGKVIVDAAVTVTAGMMPVLTAICLSGINKFGKKMQHELERMDDEDQKKLLWEAYESLDDIAEKTVRKFEQTTVSKLKAAADDGKLTDEEIGELSGQVYSEIIDTLNLEYQVCLQENLGNLEKYIVSTVEDKVLKLKGR